jgi:hypothetical protein
VAEQPGPVEALRDVLGAISDAWDFVVLFGISVALLVMGNTLARSIGAGLLAIWLYFAIRLLRRRFAN